MKLIIRSIIIELCAVVIGSIAGVFIILAVYKLITLLRIDINFAGDKSNILFPLFFGLPIGSVGGIVLANRLFLDNQRWNILGIVIALILNVAGLIIGVRLLDILGGKFWFLIPVIGSIGTIAGYKISVLLTGK